MRTVRLARAALLYFLEAIEYNERACDRSRVADGYPGGTLYVHPHHEIRGNK
jgi:hypothetical protein